MPSSSRIGLVRLFVDQDQSRDLVVYFRSLFASFSLFFSHSTTTFDFSFAAFPHFHFFIKSIINHHSSFKMSFSRASINLPGSSRALPPSDLPLAAACARCVKRYIVDPTHQCTLKPGAKICNYCAKGSSPCEKVSFHHPFTTCLSYP